MQVRHRDYSRRDTLIVKCKYTSNEPAVPVKPVANSSVNEQMPIFLELKIAFVLVTILRPVEVKFAPLQFFISK